MHATLLLFALVAAGKDEVKSTRWDFKYSAWEFLLGTSSVPGVCSGIPIFLSLSLLKSAVQLNCAR